MLKITKVNSDAIEKYISKKGYSLKDFSRISKVSVETLKKILSNNYNSVNLQTLIKIAFAMKILSSYLLIAVE